MLSGTFEINLGLHQFVSCTEPGNYCQSYSLNDDDDFNNLATVASTCYKAGSGVISMATFAMLFGLLAIISLHTYTTFKRACGCACPVPRIFVALFSILSLGLYIGVVSLWWVKCHNNISPLLWTNGKGGIQGPQGFSVGYALMVAVICTVFSLLGWIFATIRSFMPDGDDGTPSKTTSYGASSGSASPAHANGGYGNNAQSPSGGGGGEGSTFGY